MGKLKSRKFWMGVFGAVAPYVMKALSGEVTWKQVIVASTTAIVAYILGESSTDVAGIIGGVSNDKA